MIVYTSCNDAYIPGVTALYKSYKKHNKDGRFVVLYDGDEPWRITDIGAEVVTRPKVNLSCIPITDNRPLDTAQVHCYRFAIPELTDGDRAIYIDADAIVIKNLTPLWELEFDEAIAATRSNSPLRKEIKCVDPNRFRIDRLNAIPNEYGFISSLLIFNLRRWREDNVTEKCRKASADSRLHFKTGDQGLLNWVLYKKWHHLPLSTQAHVGREEDRSFPQNEVFIKHFLGTNPWDEIPEHLQPYPMFKLQAREEWKRYYDLRLDV